MTKENIQHYSIRKLSIGAISVIVGSFFLTSGQTVYADTINNANTSIMPKSKITLSNKKLAVNKIQLYNQLVTKNKLHKIAALLLQTGEDKGTVIGII